MWVICNKKNEINERKRHKSTYKAGKKKRHKATKKEKDKKVIRKKVVVNWLKKYQEQNFIPCMTKGIHTHHDHDASF